MERLSLQQRITHTRIVTSIAFLLLSLPILYVVVSYSVREELDAHLTKKRDELMVGFDTGKLSPFDFMQTAGGEEWFELTPVMADSADSEPRYFSASGDYFDLKGTQRSDKYRVLSQHIVLRQGIFGIKVVESELDWDKTVYRILAFIIVLLCGFIFAITSFDRLTFKRFFLPLFNTINTLSLVDNEKALRREFAATEFSEINQLHSSLNAMNKKLDDVFVRQKRFIQTASHELLTPLTIISQKSELALMNSLLDDNTAQTLVQIQETSNQLSRLSRALLLLTKIDNEQIKRNERVLISEIIEKVISDLAMLFESRSIEISLDLLPMQMAGNGELFSSMIFNVVKNAVMYADKGSTLHIFSKKYKSGFVLCFQDRGPGLSEDQLHIIHEQSIWVLPKKVRGHGLGFPLIRAIAHLHGLHLTVENKNGGLRLCFRGA